MKYLLTILCALFLIGCEKPKETINTENVSSFKSPETIGTLEDGRVIQRIKVSTEYETHWVYFTGSDITVNRRENKRNVVEVYIDGVKYEKSEK